MKVILLGELLEKATRVLTSEERAIFDIDWVGKDGSKRKLEVCQSILKVHDIDELNATNTASYGSAEAKKVFSVRSQMAGPRSQI